MKKIQMVFITTLFVWHATSIANSRVYEDSNFSIADFNTVPEAVNSITAVLERQGMEVVAVIDHAANAKKIDLKLPPTQLILFRDRRLETRLLAKSQTAGIDLPIKILVFEDLKSGKIKLFYNAAGYILDRHNIKTRDHLLSRLNRRLAQFGELEKGLITIESDYSVVETVENLKAILLENGFLIPFTFDFTENSFYRYHQNQSQLIIFGNPKVGTPLMQNQQSIGIDLPQKFLVWEDRKGQVHISYNDTLFIGKRHGLQGLDTTLKNISNRLGELAAEGAGTFPENKVVK